ncbi:MAG: hypothetical protein PHN88_10400 [Ignavibacteria bacterium]|nr:hypothetical protein [Ignavibacteria bacterium]
MGKIIVLLMLLTTCAVYSQDISGGVKFSGNSDLKAQKAIDITKDVFNYTKISGIRQINYETTKTGDLVLKRDRIVKKSEDTSIEDNFNKNSNMCPNGNCGSNLLLWGAVSVAAGIFSILTLKK